MPAPPGNNMRNANATVGQQWTPELDEALKKYLAANLSFADVAGEINREFGTSYSRCAATGRAHRLGLRSSVPKSEGSKRQARYHGGERRKPSKPKPPAPPVVFKCEPSTGLRVADVVPRNISLLDLEPGECRWPYGDSNFTFCGNPTLDGCSYCHQHFALSVGGGTESERRAHQGVAA